MCILLFIILNILFIFVVNISIWLIYIANIKYEYICDKLYIKIFLIKI